MICENWPAQEKVDRLEQYLKKIEKRKFYGQYSSQRNNMLPQYADLTFDQCLIIRCVAEAEGWVGTRLIYKSVYGDRPKRKQPTIKTLIVQMFKLKEKLAPLGIIIQSQHGRGYFMSDESKALLAEVTYEVAA